MTRDPGPAAPAAASRRGVVGGLGSLLLGSTAVGCELGATREDRPGAGPASTAPPVAEDPDAELVRRVVEDLTAALALAGGLARARGGLTREVAPWRELHTAHLEALEAPGRTRPLRLRGSPAALRSRLRREESALQRSLARAAVSARSGALASLLAVMSAAVAQRLAADAPGAAS